jgi:hypothetical protein
MKDQDNWVNNWNGTITDTSTKLMWQEVSSFTVIDEESSLFRDETAQYKSWKEANEYCKNLQLGKFNNWRLPTIKELLKLIDYKQISPAINIKFKHTVLSYYWSSTEYLTSPSYVWCVNFYDGTVTHISKNKEYYIRAVRNSI